jgi:hypothetical protein
MALYREIIPSKAKEQAIQGIAQCMVQLKDWEGLKSHSAAHQNNQSINPLFFKALNEIAEHEMNPDPNKPLSEQVNIAFAYGFIGLPREGLALLDQLSGKFPENPEVEMARRRLSQRR